MCDGCKRPPSAAAARLCCCPCGTHRRGSAADGGWDCIVLWTSARTQSCECMCACVHDREPPSSKHTIAGATRHFTHSTELAWRHVVRRVRFVTFLAPPATCRVTCLTRLAPIEGGKRARPPLPGEQHECAGISEVCFTLVITGRAASSALSSPYRRICTTVVSRCTAARSRTPVPASFHFSASLT